MDFVHSMTLFLNCEMDVVHPHALGVHRGEPMARHTAGKVPPGLQEAPCAVTLDRRLMRSSARVRFQSTAQCPGEVLQLQSQVLVLRFLPANHQRHGC